MDKLDVNGKYQYGIVQTKTFVDGIGEIKTFSIELISQKDRVLVSDVSTDLDRISMLLALLNRNDVSPIHLLDVIDDFLVEF